jgi:DinB superfamily
MNHSTLQHSLKVNHQKFTELIASLSDEAFVKSINDKWTPGQQLEHIYLSIKPLRIALTLPKFMLKLIWGKANRKSKTFEELVAKYQHKLAQGGRATGRFVPKPVTVAQRDQLVHWIHKEINSICVKLNKFSEAELDTYILPHPLLGKLTLKEMMYFTIYHVEHHQRQL